MKVKKRSKVWGAVTSLTFTNDFTHFFAGTADVKYFLIIIKICSQTYTGLTVIN